MGLFSSLFGGKKAVGGPAPKKLARVNVSRRFTIIAETAQGSMSRVYKAMDNDNGRSVCLKLQLADKTAAALARTGKSVRPSEGEMGSAVNHKHVCKTYEYGMTTKGEYFLVMEFIEGISLTQTRQSRVLTLGQKLDFLAQAAEGLSAVHAAGYIHHDIGPKNFLVDRKDVVKLIDFGLAVPNTPEFNRPGNRTGTLNYMAPELVRREATDSRLDIFSFGSLAFELLTNKLPYEGISSMEQMLKRINAQALDPAEANPRLPQDVCELIRKTLVKKKEDRWPAMSTLAIALQRLADAQPAAPRPKELDDLGGFGLT